MSASVVADSYVSGPPASFNPKSIPGLLAWYSAEAETGYTSGQTITQWTDLSGNGNHAIPAALPGPVWNSTLGPAGGPTLVIEGEALKLPAGVMGSAVSGEVATTMWARVSNQGWWTFGGGVDAAHFTYSGNHYENFGSTQRPSAGAASLSTWYRIQAMSKPGNLSVWRDGVNKVSTGTNTVSWAAQPQLNISAQNSWIFRGRMTTLALYNRELTTTERADLLTWMNSHPSGGLP